MAGKKTERGRGRERQRQRNQRIDTSSCSLVSPSPGWALNSYSDGIKGGALHVNAYGQLCTNSIKFVSGS